MRFYLAVLVGLLGVVPGVVMAQDGVGLTLSDAISEAKLHSPVIQKAQAALAQSEWKRSEIFGGGFMPKLSADATHFFDHHYQILEVPLNGNPVSFPTIYPTTMYGVSLKLPLFDGFASTHQVEAEDSLVKAAEQDLAQVSFQLEEDVRLAYYQAQTAEILESVTGHHVHVLEDHFKQAQIQKNGGVATDYDVLRVQVQLSEARLDAGEAYDNVAISRQKLTQYLGLRQDDRRLLGVLPTPNSKLVEALGFDEGLAARADIQALGYRQQALLKKQASETPWFCPSISAIATYDLYNNIDDALTSSSSFRTDYQTGVVLSWALFDGGISQAKSKAFAAQQAQMQATLEEVRLTAASGFLQWQKRYLSSALRFKIKQLDAQRSEESVRLVLLERRAGTRTNTEVLDAELDLFRSKAGTVQAQMNAAEALIKLELVLGRRL